MRLIAPLAVAPAVLIGVGAATADPGPGGVRSSPPGSLVVSNDHVRQHATMRYQSDMDRMLAW